MMPTRYVIGLGSNRRHGRHGAPEHVLDAAIRTMAAEGLSIVATSPCRTSAPLGPSLRRFANAAALIETDLAPHALLACLKAIESRFGRRRGRRWGARVLDLDILAWSGGRWDSRRLTIPHAALRQRDFALDPAAQIAPLWRIGRPKATLRQLAARLRTRRPASEGPVVKSGVASPRPRG